MDVDEWKLPLTGDRYLILYGDWCDRIFWHFYDNYDDVLSSFAKRIKSFDYWCVELKHNGKRFLAYQKGQLDVFIDQI